MKLRAALGLVLALGFGLSLSACGKTPVGLGASAAGAAGYGSLSKASEEKARLAKLLDKKFDAIFELYDANDDKKWTPEDFGLDEKRFLNLFGPTDTNDDHVVVRDEFFPKEVLTERVAYIMARAPITVKGVGGRVTPDKAEFILAVYLQGLLNKSDAKKGIAEAFEEADEDKSGYLVADEMSTAYALLEAKSTAKGIEKKVNRSRGQGNLPVTNDPPAWVAKKKRR